MTVHNQLPVTYFSNFFVLTNLLEGESQIQQDTVSWWPPLFQPCMNISFSPGSGAFEKQHNWKSSHFSTSFKNLSFLFFSERWKKENWSSVTKLRMKDLTAAVCLATKKTPTWGLLLKSSEQENTAQERSGSPERHLQKQKLSWPLALRSRWKWEHSQGGKVSSILAVCWVSGLYSEYKRSL